MAMQIRKASRNMTYAKILLTGPSGSGKSYGALTLAKGMISQMPDLGGNSKRIGYIGTESMRDELYADQFDYDVISLPKDLKNLQGYNEAFDTFLAAGYGVIIIDSLSHLWEWVQKMVQEEESSNRTTHRGTTNGVSLWGKWKKENKAFQNKILFSECHVICTARAKDEYVMEQDERGKTTIKKVGVGAQQDKDTEYEFMLSLMLDQKTHLSWATKDNTHLWDGAPSNRQARVITEADGAAIMQWAINGVSQEDQIKIANLRTQITDIANSKGGTKNPLFMTIYRNLMTGQNYMKLENIEVLESIKAELEKAPGMEEYLAQQAKAAEVVQQAQPPQAPPQDAGQEQPAQEWQEPKQQ